VDAGAGEDVDEDEGGGRMDGDGGAAGGGVFGDCCLVVLAEVAPMEQLQVQVGQQEPEVQEP
jgi:hypothetical protein